MHVLHVIDALSIGGAERMLVEIANRTSADGHRVSVCVTRTGLALAPALSPAVELFVLGRTGRVDVWPLVRLARWLKTERVTIVHCHGRSSFSLMAVLAAARATRVPILMHDHLGVEAHPDAPVWFRIAQRYLAAYVAVSEPQLAWARRAGVPTSRQHLIVNAIDTAALKHKRVTGEPLEPAAGHRLVCVGGIRREKAIDVLLEAVARMRTRATLHIIGGDLDRSYAERCRERAQQNDLLGRVRFLGQRDDALAVAATCDLGVHAARSESGPLVLAEYAALGVPFVSTNVGEIARLLADAGIGAFVAPDDPQALADAIDGALALPVNVRQQEGQRGIAVAHARFDLASVIQRWYSVYAALDGSRL